MRGGKQPPSQELIWHNQPGLGVLLLNINDFTEHQYQKSPLCDHDDGSRKKTDYSYSFLNIEKIMTIVQTTKMTKNLLILTNRSDCCFIITALIGFTPLFLPPK